VEPVSLLVIVLGFFGRPLAEAVRDRYVQELVDRLPGAAEVSARMQQLIAGTASGDREAERRLEAELDADRQTARVLANALSARTGETLPSVGDQPRASGFSNDGRAVLLDGYQRALYNLTLAAVFAGRPVVVDGALQGPGWLTACSPRFRDDSQYDGLLRAAVPEPSMLWYPYSIEDVEHGFTFPDEPNVTFHVRRLPDPQERQLELARREEQFQFTPRSSLPASAVGTAPQDRWLRIVRVRPRWVNLESDATDFAVPKPEYVTLLESAGLPQTPTPRHLLGFEEYPDDWRPLLKIPQPDEGIRSLMDATDALVRHEYAIRETVQGLVGRNAFSDGSQP
jgi:hypothetical protein